MLIESRASSDAELGALLISEHHELGAAQPRQLGADDDTAYLVVVVQGRAVACGGWRPLEPGTAELRRIFVRPAFRGRGIAGQLLVALEEEALAADRPVLRLEPGDYSPAARALFRSAGYLSFVKAPAVVSSR